MYEPTTLGIRLNGHLRKRAALTSQSFAMTQAVNAALKLGDTEEVDVTHPSKQFSRVRFQMLHTIHILDNPLAQLIKV